MTIDPKNLPASYSPADYADTLAKPYDPKAQPFGAEITALLHHAVAEGRAAILSSTSGPQSPHNFPLPYELAMSAMHDLPVWQALMAKLGYVKGLGCAGDASYFRGFDDGVAAAITAAGKAVRK